MRRVFGSVGAKRVPADVAAVGIGGAHTIHTAWPETPLVGLVIAALTCATLASAAIVGATLRGLSFIEIPFSVATAGNRARGTAPPKRFAEHRSL